LNSRIVAEIKFFKIVEMGKSFGGDLLDVAVGEVERDELWNHLEGVGLQLLQGVVVKSQLT
jgi:hypothetical protein